MPESENIDWDSLSFRLSSVFQPSAPINSDDLFRGRTAQVRAVVDAINQPGRHAVLFGARGVGKTSLGHTLPEKLSTAEPVPIISPFITCDSSDDYWSIWRKVFIEIRYQSGSTETPDDNDPDPIEDVNTQWSPFEVRRAIAPFAREGLLYVVLDEFDKVEDKETRQLIADTIKLFSDHVVPVTLIIVGVSDDATGLIDDHRSIERCLAQIRMPRMPRHELEDIVVLGLKRLDMAIAPDAISEITGLSKGLPMYAHLLALHASRGAIDEKHLDVRLDNVQRAIKTAISHIEETIRAEYDKATYSTRKTLYSQVLLACAMAHSDEYGRFQPNDVCEPLQTITGESYTTDRFSSHLKKFCTPERGSVLRKTGGQYRWRYQFRNPLLQPYVLMKGLDANVITEEQLNLNKDDDDQHPLFKGKSR